MKIPKIIFLIFLCFFIFLFSPAGMILDSHTEKTNVVLIVYFVCLFASGGIYFILNLFVMKEELVPAFLSYILIIVIANALLCVFNAVASSDSVSILLCFLNLVSFFMLGASCFWLVALLLKVFRVTIIFIKIYFIFIVAIFILVLIIYCIE